MKGRLLFCLGLLLLGAAVHADESDPETAATVISLNGLVNYEEEAGVMQSVELGQVFEAGDHLQTGADSSLQLLLADGSTIALGPNSELQLTELGKGGEGSRTLLQLLGGTLNSIVEKLTGGAVYEVQSQYGIAAVKGTQFELSADADESAVTVHEGNVEFADPSRSKSVRVAPLQRASARRDRLERAFDLSKRDAGDFVKRWERARMVHAARNELRLGVAKDRRRFVKMLLKRRAARRRRLKHGASGSMEERRRAARARFEKARQELEKERR